ncbi:MAG: peroxiredoxin [Algoriphagus sp.]|jgi:peroxiredoxin
MKNTSTFISVLLFLAVMSACKTEPSPDEVFDETKGKLDNAKLISFELMMLWENPLIDEVDTIRMSLELGKEKSESFEYNFIGRTEESDLVYQEDVILNVNHTDSTLVLKDKKEDLARYLDNAFFNFSPIGLLKKKGWAYIGDTSIANKNYLNYRQIEMDTVIEKKDVLLENHLFLNPSNLLFDKYERRLFHDGKKGQFITVNFSNYKLSGEGEFPRYIAPIGYISKIAGDIESRILLQKGEKAPDFELKDLEGNTVSLSDFKGKKVLIDFSMIRCGWCKIALDKFNSPEFSLKEGIVALYINPVDDQEYMKKYLTKNKIPFPILLEAAEVGKTYGVSGYPSFFFIDERGDIEFSGAGFDDELIPLISN